MKNRFTEKLTTLPPSNPAVEAVIIDLLDKQIEYCHNWERNLWGPQFLDLLDLVRSNPAEVYRTYDEFQRERGVGPNAYYATERQAVGIAISVTTRNPMYQFLKARCPEDHRVWRYINLVPIYRRST